jgi:hypothetical protein
LSTGRDRTIRYSFRLPGFGCHLIDLDRPRKHRERANLHQLLFERPEDCANNLPCLGGARLLLLDCGARCRPQQEFSGGLVKALRNARLMILVFTSNANNSNEIKKKVVLSGRHHVTVVPVRVEDVVPNNALAYAFATR